MDATQCLAHVAQAVGATVPPGGQSADYITGLIICKLETGPQMQLLQQIINQLDMLVACRAQGQDDGECLEVLEEHITEWRRRMNSFLPQSEPRG